jgi:hypothetical protein
MRLPISRRREAGELSLTGRIFGRRLWVGEYHSACFIKPGISIRVLLMAFLYLVPVGESLAKDETISLSPDGRYEVVVVDEADGSGSFARIREKKTKKKFYTEAMGYEHSRAIHALWRQDSKVVAINFSAGKHRDETVLYSLVNGVVSKVTLPDFVLNILGRQGAVSAKFRGAVIFVKFLPENKCEFFAHVEPEFPEEKDRMMRLDPEFRPTSCVEFKITLSLTDTGQTELIAVEPDEVPDSPPKK